MIPPIPQVNSPVAGSLAQALSLAGSVITYVSRPASRKTGTNSRHETQSLRLRDAFHAVGGDLSAADVRRRTAFRMTRGMPGNRNRAGSYSISGVILIRACASIALALVAATAAHAAMSPCGFSGLAITATCLVSAAICAACSWSWEVWR